MFFASAFGYLLTLLLSFTLILFLAFILRVLLVLLFSKVYTMVVGKNNPMALINTSIKVVQPAGFLTSIFHGYASVWMGVVLLTGLSVPVDWFLGVFLGASFLYWGSRNLSKNTKITFNENENEKDLGNNTTLIINPEEASSENHMKNKLEEQLKGKVQNFMEENKIIGLMGKLAGVALASLNYIPF